MKTSVQAEPRTPVRSGPVSVMVVDDCGDILASLQSAAKGEPGITLVGALQSSTNVLAEVNTRGAQVVVMDLIMPGEEPLKRIRELREQCPEVRIIAYTGHDDARTIDVAFEAGASTLVSKGVEPRALFEEVRRAVFAHPGERHERV